MQSAQSCHVNKSCKWIEETELSTSHWLPGSHIWEHHLHFHCHFVLLKSVKPLQGWKRVVWVSRQGRWMELIEKLRGYSLHFWHQVWYSSFQSLIVFCYVFVPSCFLANCTSTAGCAAVKTNQNENTFQQQAPSLIQTPSILLNCVFCLRLHSQMLFFSHLEESQPL